MFLETLLAALALATPAPPVPWDNLAGPKPTPQLHVGKLPMSADTAPHEVQERNGDRGHAIGLSVKVRHEGSFSPRSEDRDAEEYRFRSPTAGNDDIHCGRRTSVAKDESCSGPIRCFDENNDSRFLRCRQLGGGVGDEGTREGDHDRQKNDCCRGKLLGHVTPPVLAAYLASWVGFSIVLILFAPTGFAMLREGGRSNILKMTAYVLVLAVTTVICLSNLPIRSDLQRLGDAIRGVHTEVTADCAATHHAPFLPLARIVAGPKATAQNTTRPGVWAECQNFTKLDYIAKNGDESLMGYPGGKGRMWQAITALMPPHDVYIETHLGGGAVMRNKRPASTSIGIDVDGAAIEAARAWNVPGLVLHEGDATPFLRDYAFTGRELVYLDPPYLASTKGGRRYYRHECTDEQHADLLAVITTLPCAVMISGYPSEMYGRSLGHWSRRDIANVTNAGRKLDRLWANFPFGHDLHEYGTLGADFRERERLRRKTARWAGKLAVMPETERRAILAGLIDLPEVEPEFVERLARDRIAAAS